MKTVGLITEYNPFHNGHQFHIQKAKEITGADRVIVVMSGDFVQRGEPAIMPKHLRAKIALDCGASAIFELPVCYATGSAENFAMGAVELFDQLHIVDSICFGSECGDILRMQDIAEIVLSEPEKYTQFLKLELQNGQSYPAARAQALKKYTRNTSITEIVNQPNNILGIEYLKALKRLSSKIVPYTIVREGAGYHEDTIQTDYSSASAIRSYLKESEGKVFEDIALFGSQIPISCRKLLKDHYKNSFPLFPNTFSLVLKYALLNENQFTQYMDVSEELSNRILRERNNYLNFEQFCEHLKTKELTYSRISRALIHIMLHITKRDIEHYDHRIFYARLLGFRTDEKDILAEIKRHASIPVITKLADASLTKTTAQDMLMLDCFSSDLYQSAVSELYQSPFINEYQKEVIRI